MDSIRQVKAALAARSTTQSLEELQSQGRRRVKVIKAEHVASMIEESVQRSLADDHRIPQEDVDALVEKSRTEFATVVAERQAEHAALEEARRRVELLEQQVETQEQDLTEADTENATLQTRIKELESELADAGTNALIDDSAAEQRTEELNSQLEQVQVQAADFQREVEKAELRNESLREDVDRERSRRTEDVKERDAEIDRLRTRVSELEGRLTSGSQQQQPQQNDAMSAQLMAAMMNELAGLKAQVGEQTQQAAAPQAPAFDPSVLDGLVNSMNDRLESFGKKMGISSAVEAENVDYSQMFAQSDDVELESNLDTMDVKAKAGTGIAANLDRLRKLKNGGA